MEIIQVTDYDILADALPEGKYALYDYKTHIGNTRFSVLIDMYREAYDMSHMRGNDDECEKIVDRIVGVACHKDLSITVNKGRFLVREEDEGDWVVLEDEKCREVVRQALTSQDTTQEEPLDAEGAPSDDFGSMTLAASSAGWNDKKRGRRRSLLRRSASESNMIEDKKKALRFLDDNQPSFRRFNSTGAEEPINILDGPPPNLFRHVSAPPIIVKASETIKLYSGMDVVLSASGRVLSTKENIVGNNRLEVMLGLQRGRYKDLSPDEQDKVARDLVRAVCQYWGGRVLIDQGFAYAKLDEEQSVTAMRNLLNPDDATTMTISTAEVPIKPLLSEAPPVPDFLREASLEILSSSGFESGPPESIQSAAVKSLQARKAKRAMTKNLGHGRLPDAFPEE